MDFLTIDLPISQVEDFSVLLLLGLGFMVGTLGGFFGVGGAWIVTPALNIFGFPMAYAIGTDLAHIFGKSIVATRKHSRMGNVDWRLGMFSIGGSVVGIELGKRLVLSLESAGSVDEVIRWVYIGLLILLGIYMLFDSLAGLKRSRAASNSDDDVSVVEESAPASLLLRRISLKPIVQLKVSGIDGISFWVLTAIFLLAGFLSGFMGIGGGFVLLPALIYLVGCPTTVAIGTSLLCVCIMSGYGCFVYSLAGRTELYAAMIMLAGAAVGAQVGVLATRYVRGYGIRLLFAVMVIMAGLSVAVKQGEALLAIDVLGTVAAWSVMGAAGSMTALIFIRLVLGIRKHGV